MDIQLKRGYIEICVLASMLTVLPTEKMKDALKQLYLCTPHWMGLKTALMQ